AGRSPMVDLAAHRQRYRRVRAVDLACEPMPVEDRLRQLARGHAVTDPVYALDAGLVPSVALLEQAAVERGTGLAVTAQHDRIGLPHPRRLGVQPDAAGPVREPSEAGVVKAANGDLARLDLAHDRLRQHPNLEFSHQPVDVW